MRPMFGMDCGNAYAFLSMTSTVVSLRKPLQL